MRKIILWYSLAILLGIILWVGITWQHFMTTPLIPTAGRPVDYVFKPGASITTLANDLQNLGMLQHPDFFIALVYSQGATKKLQAGEYLFSPGITPKQLLNQMIKGQVVYHRFTIVEGWTFKKLLTALNNAPQITHTFSNANIEKIMMSLGLPMRNPEGLFFPATYSYAADATDISLLKQAYQKMNKELRNQWSKRAANLPYKTPYEALIAASLVEKETAQMSERPLIAGVIERRLKQNIPLQIDSTVIYGLGDNYTGKIKLADLQQDTLYNTYTRRGLPPTPIAMPSLAALNAVLHPDNSNFMYFVAKGDGTHQFSTSLQEQNQAVTLYQIDMIYPVFMKKIVQTSCGPWYLSTNMKRLLNIQCQKK